MLIRSIIERKAGTKVELEGTTYHFQPVTPNGPHVAKVANKDHIARFLAIREGFELAEQEPQAPVQEPQAPDQPADGAIDGVAALAAVQADPEGVSPEIAVAAFTFLFDRAPNPKAKHETIVAKIMEQAVEAGAVGGAGENQ